jgi:hypothetical protein
MFLRILDFECSPEEISKTIGIKATKTWLKGDLISEKLAIIRKQNRWELSSGIKLESDFNDHLDTLLAILSPSTDKFKSLPTDYYTELACVLYMHDNESTPSVHFTKEQLTKLADLGLEIDFDIYLVPN